MRRSTQLAGPRHVVPSRVLTHVLHPQRELHGGTSGLCDQLDTKLTVFLQKQNVFISLKLTISNFDCDKPLFYMVV